MRKRRSGLRRKVVRSNKRYHHYNLGRIGVLLLGILIVLASGICLAIYAMDKDGGDSSSGSSSSQTSESKQESSLSSEDISASVSSDPSVSSKEPESSSEEPSSESSKPPESSEASKPPVNSDFSNALFIGNSRTRGFMLYAGVPEATYFTSTGLNVTTAMTKAIVDAGSGNMVTIPQALRMKQYSKVYVMLGINELGWPNPSVFIQKYQTLVNEIKATQPGAAIYIQSILPVTAEKSAADAYINNPRINEFNQLIQQMAASSGVQYLNVAQGIADASGNLPNEATTDGVHLNPTYCVKWKEYLNANS